MGISKNTLSRTIQGEKMKNKIDDYGSAENQVARLKESEYYKVMSNGNYEQVTCSQCNGSGEGMYEGEKCKTCKGSGVELVEIEDEETANDMIESMETDIDMAIDNDPELMSDWRPELS